MKPFPIKSLLILLLTGCTPDNSSQALGTLERDRVTFTATANEIIRALPVKEGSQVKQGDVLVQLDTTSQRAILARAIAKQSQAEAYLLKLTNGERPEDIAVAQARVKRAQAQLTEAQKDYQRKTELAEKKVLSQAQKDIALASRDSTRAELDSANEEFRKLTAGARLEDIDQAKAELAAAIADVTLQKQKLTELTVTATRDGILDSLPYNLGERVPVNGVIAVIQAGLTPYARVYIPAQYRVEFTPGKSVSINVDGVDKPISGQVRWVSSEPSFTPYYALSEDERSRLMYLAEIDLNSAAQALPSGIPAQVELSNE